MATGEHAALSKRRLDWRTLAIILCLSVAQPMTAFAHAKAEHAAESSEAASPSDETIPLPAWPTDDDSGMMMSHGPKPTTFTGRLVAWLGAWHPAVIHFPIALVLVAALFEIIDAMRKTTLSRSVKPLLAVAALGGVIAAALGWANAGLPAASDESALTVHRWLGSALPFLLLLLWRLKPAGGTSRTYGAALAVSALAILTQAYFGAEVTHGAGHLAF